MSVTNEAAAASRYVAVTEAKSAGATYTPAILADFVASKIVEAFGEVPTDRPLRVLDPGVGDGELLVSLLRQIAERPGLNIEVHGFETDEKALNVATGRLRQCFPNIEINLKPEDFLEFVLEYFGADGNRSLSGPPVPDTYDLIIANPPYVRTQIMGRAQARLLAKQFGLSGRADLCHAFILGMAQVIEPKGVAGIIVSNRFMTTRAGAPVRRVLCERFNIRHVWDLGDTKLFDAAVLPAVLLVEGKNERKLEAPGFTSIYETSEPANAVATDPIRALAGEGVVVTDDGRHFRVQHGKLDTSGTSDGVWRIATATVDAWLATVEAHTWGTFRDIGNIRVGVKTCADKVFIRSDWQDMPEATRPELLKPLTTHHIARRFKPRTLRRPWEILYPHEVVQGRRRAVNLARYPRSRAYLESHRAALESRKYVIEAGREWYEIWVPQDPSSWRLPKLAFRDIAEEPTFWIDMDGSVVNGDCYWIICRNPGQMDLLWLAAAVGNSTFMESFYDYRFHNKLYAGRRRFITQYVEKFPLPDPHSPLGKAIIAMAKRIYKCIESPGSDRLQKKLDKMVWEAFGFEIRGVTSTRCCIGAGG
ncbi:MAG: type II restriction endonuclease subunit M [Deltaproteobacteria bacterium]|nr:MAG: type II restriction endonuclease subunit M [Deltaproteobacteria bacterium]